MAPNRAVSIPASTGYTGLHRFPVPRRQRLHSPPPTFEGYQGPLSLRRQCGCLGCEPKSSALGSDPKDLRSASPPSFERPSYARIALQARSDPLHDPHRAFSVRLPRTSSCTIHVRSLGTSFRQPAGSDLTPWHSASAPSETVVPLLVVPIDSRPSANTGHAPDAASGSSRDGPRSSGPSIRFRDRSGPPRREAPPTRSISRLVQPARTVFQHPIGVFLVSWLDALQPQSDEVHDHVRLPDDCLQASYGR